MLSKSIVLKSALIGAVLAALQSAAALAADPNTSAEAPIVVVAAGEDVNEKGETNNIQLAQNDVDDGAKNDVDDGAKNDVDEGAKNDVDDSAKNDDATDMHDGAHDAMEGGKQDTAESIRDQQDQMHNESGQKGN